MIQKLQAKAFALSFRRTRIPSEVDMPLRRPLPRLCIPQTEKHAQCTLAKQLQPTGPTQGLPATRIIHDARPAAQYDIAPGHCQSTELSLYPSSLQDV